MPMVQKVPKRLKQEFLKTPCRTSRFCLTLHTADTIGTGQIKEQQHCRSEQFRMLLPKEVVEEFVALPAETERVPEDMIQGISRDRVHMALIESVFTPVGKHALCDMLQVHTVLPRLQCRLLLD